MPLTLPTTITLKPGSHRLPSEGSCAMEVAALVAGLILGFINAIGNLGGAFGSSMMGRVRTATGSFSGGLTVLSAAMVMSALIIFFLGLGKRSET